MLKETIQSVSTGALYMAIKDAEQRIGSHITLDYPDPNYIQKQKELIYMAQEELENRR